jgi:hypothetical protein
MSLPERQAPKWADELYERKLEEGFEPHEVVVVPDQPVSRVPKSYDFGVYDYSGRVLPYKLRSDVRHADYNTGMNSQWERRYGAGNVDAIPLPTGFERIDETYPHRVHRLVVINRKLVREQARGWVDFALSDGPHSVSEAMREADNK